MLCVDAVPATAAMAADRAAESSVVVAVVTAVVADVDCVAAVDAVDDAARLDAAEVAVAAIPPVRAISAATLNEPVILRARLAGCGRRRRDPVGVLPVVVLPVGFKGLLLITRCTSTSIGGSGERDLGAGQEAGKNLCVAGESVS